VIDELEAVAPEAGEHDALRRRVTLLKDARRWAEFARDAHALLYEADDAIAGRLAGLLERVRQGVAGSDQLGVVEEQLALAQVACEEAARAASRFAEELPLDPSELEGLEDRLHELERLRRKHGVEADELADLLTAMRTELDELENADEHVARLEARTEKARVAALASATALHERRVAAANGLARAVEGELAALHIPKARLEVEVGALEEPGPLGIDRVEFLFSANSGEPLAPLRRVASGGELSRVLLALKGALAAEDRVATYVFDEVDAGVGGAVAEAIGRRLARAAAQHQVLCVTHLPQIAAFADAHYRVDKLEKRGRTLTQVVKLDEAGRVDELARMLGGSKVGASAREHASALLEQARAPARKPRAARR
jgi:DNA repair protein RecN (Recombination protein N)